MSIYKEVAGQGEDIVLIHGTGSDHRYMQTIADILLPHYRITNIDLPGMGQSPWQSQINSIDDFADAILPYLPEQAIYLPWSLGGQITISIAARYPQRVRRIIGVAVSPRFIEDEGWPGIPQPGFKAAFAEIREVGFKSFFKSFCVSEFADFDTKPKEYEQLCQLVDETTYGDLEIVLKGMNIADMADLREEFKTVQCPIDLILGGRDPSLPTTCHEPLKQLNARTVLHVIPEAHHIPFWTHPQEFKSCLKALLPGL